MNKVQKRKIIGVAVISGVILVSVASVGAVKLVKEANATEVNKYVTAKNTDFLDSSSIQAINIDKNGGTGGTDRLYKTSEKIYLDSEATNEATMIEIPSKTGYTFRGYYYQQVKMIEKDGTINENMISNISQITGLYAEWDSKLYTYTLDKQNGKGGDDFLYCSFERAYYRDLDRENLVSDKYSMKIPTKEGYAFGGYYTSANGEGDKIITEEGYITSEAMEKYLHMPQDFTLYAKWNKINKITLDKAGVITAGRNTIYSAGNMAYDDSEATTILKEITPPKAVGYDFKGYYYKNENNTEIEIITENGKITDNIKLLTTDSTIVAKWELNGVKILYLDSYGTLGDPRELYAKDGKVYYDEDLNNEITNINEPNRRGYILKGYYTKYKEQEYIIDENGHINFDYVNDICNNNTDVYIEVISKWSKMHKLTLNSGVGYNDIYYFADSDVYDGDYIVMAQKKTKINPPKKTNYIFKGYYYTKEDNTEIEIITEEGKITDNIGLLSEDTTLTAKWVESSIQTIILKDDKNDTTDSIYLKDGKVYSDEMCITEITKIEVPIKYGYQFKGFKYNGITIVDSEGNIAIDNINQIHTNYTDDYEAEAEWIEEKFVIHYDANGGEGAPKDSEYNLNEIMIKKIDSTIPTKLGYTFVEWNTDINGTGTKYHPSQQVFVDNSGETTLYAQWEPIKYYIEYQIRYGESDSSLVQSRTQECVYDSEVTIEGDDRENFQGWATDTYNGEVKYRAGEVVKNLLTEDGARIELWQVMKKNEDESIDVTGINVTPTSSEIKVGGTATITATVKPDNATNKNVTWSSSNTAVATVSESGVITGKSEGTATITATTVDGNYTAEATITVKKDIEDTEGPKITVEQTKDSEGRYIVLIKVTNESGIKEVKVNNTVLKADEDGNYSFISNENGKYNIKVTDTEGNTSTYSYEETRFSENGGNNSGNNNNGGNNGNSGNSGNKDNSGSNGNFNNNGNSGNGTIENKNNLNNNGSNNTTGKTGDTITTSTALTELPKTGSTMGVLFAAIASGISAIIAWFKHRKMKQ